MENIIKELKELGADVELLDSGLLKLNGSWINEYREYHEYFSIISGSLMTNIVQHKDFLPNLTSLGSLHTYDTVQHKDFLPNLNNLGILNTYNVVQHKDFLSNLTNLGYLDTHSSVQHKDFLSNLTNLGSLNTHYSVQHEDFLSNLTNLGNLNTHNAVQHKDFLSNLTNLGSLYTYYSVQHKDFLSNLTNLGSLYTYYSVQHKDFLSNLTNLGLNTYYSVQHKDFLSNLTIGDVELPYIYKDGILSKVLSTKIVDGITVHSTNSVGYNKIEYVAIDGEYSAHASTIKMALIDLNFKKSNRDVSWLTDKNLTDILSFEDSILAYRCITGACSGGVESFIKSIEEKDEYKISEIIELTKDQYGNKEFENFFIK